MLKNDLADYTLQFFLWIFVLKPLCVFLTDFYFVHYWGKLLFARTIHYNYLPHLSFTLFGTKVQYTERGSESETFKRLDEY